MGQIDHFGEKVIRELIPFRCYIGNIGTNATLIDHFEVVGTLIAKSACSLGGQWLWSIPWLDCLKISHLSAYMAKLYYDHQSRHLWMWEIGWKVNWRSFRISHDIGLPSSFGRIMRLKCTKKAKIGDFFFSLTHGFAISHRYHSLGSSKYDIFLKCHIPPWRKS